MKDYKSHYMLIELLYTKCEELDQESKYFAIEHCMDEDYDVAHFGPNGYFIFGTRFSPLKEVLQ